MLMGVYLQVFFVGVISVCPFGFSFALGVWVVVDFDFLKEEMNIDLGFFSGCFMAFILVVYGVFGRGLNRVVNFCVGFSLSLKLVYFSGLVDWMTEFLGFL
jgi:hypothetical protein